VEQGQLHNALKYINNMNTPFQNRIKKQERRNERLMRKAARISARQSGESMGGIDYELPKVQKVLGKINKAKTISYNDVDPRVEEQGKRYDSGINYGSPLNGAYESGAGASVYVSNAPAFSKLQNQINASTKEAISGLVENKKGPTSEDKKNQAEEAYWKSLTKTSEKTDKSGITEEQIDGVFDAGSTIDKFN